MTLDHNVARRRERTLCLLILLAGTMLKLIYALQVSCYVPPTTLAGSRIGCSEPTDTLNTSNICINTGTCFRQARSAPVSSITRPCFIWWARQ